MNPYSNLKKARGSEKYSDSPTNWIFFFMRISIICLSAHSWCRNSTNSFYEYSGRFLQHPEI